jgi:signal transduction histidine kinase
MVPMENFSAERASLSLLAALSRRAVASGTTGLHGLLGEYAVAAVEATGAVRGFVALAEFAAGGLVPVGTAGDGWTDERRATRLADRDGAGTITARVATTGRPVRVGDVPTAIAPDYRPFFPDTRSVLAVPVAPEPGGRVRGVINVESARPDAFTAAHEAFVSAVADLAALRIALADLERREAALVQMGRELAAAPRPEKLMKRVVEIAGEILRFEDCSLFLADPATGRFVLAATAGPTLAPQVRRASYAPGEGLTGWVAAHGEAVRVGDPREDPRHRGLHLEMAADEMGALLAVPIKARRGPVGVLRVLRRKTASPWFPVDFTEADQKVLETIASQVGAAADNADLLERLVQSERMAAWGEMSAMTSHQIGNRVFAIRGSLNELEHLVGRDGAPGEPLSHVTRGDVQELLRETWQGMTRLEELLGEFRDFVRASSLSAVPVDATEVVRAAVAETFPKQAGVALTEDYAPEPLPVSADPVKLRRALGELVENAVTFVEGREGAALRVATRRIGPGEPLPTGVAPPPTDGGAGWACVTVEDNGPGVPDADKARIFRPFITSRTRGMGLGLAIVQGIVDAHRGTGARFTLLLPLREG